MSTSLSIQPLTARCGRCNKTENLMRCTRCKVMLYCSREHQTCDYSNHKPACSVVAKKQKLLDHEEEKLRNESSDDFSIPPDPFKNAVGLFWRIFGTRDYMQARYGLIDALKDINTYDAVEKQLEHALDMLRLCRGDNMGIRYLVPPLFLRLNRDQECYDFIKWWCTTGQNSHYDWGNMDLGYLDIQGADPFESITGLVYKFGPLGMYNPLALLKIKLLLDLLALKNSADVPPLQEIPRSPIISRNKSLLERDDHTTEIRELEDQVRQLYAHIHKSSPSCWGLLLNPGDRLKKEKRPDAYSMGSMEEAQIMLGYAYDAWCETPGALAVIKAEYDGGSRTKPDS